MTSREENDCCKWKLSMAVFRKKSGSESLFFRLPRFQLLKRGMAVVFNLEEKCGSYSTKFLSCGILIRVVSRSWPLTKERISWYGKAFSRVLEQLSSKTSSR